ncbi:hypothetical protein BGC31_07210 [Komagataeibacter xylinus]|nr:proline imino-peptidase [Komagataeibacter xylinus E25]RFP01095.1 hypothetical protein BGC31_07210 [Komagataeibacter xylinus]RFP04012.1 hypothetical protein BFX83_09345 [Komagataeibacter xylinus]
MNPLNVERHIVPFQSFRTWARVTTLGRTDKVRSPVVVLHGGPGLPHDYCLPMTALCEDGRPVIHYDQIGCGRSSHLPDMATDFWNIDLFVEELRNLVDHFGLADGFHMLGQSWGGMLASEFVLRYPKGVLSMTLSNVPAAMPLWIRGINGLLSRLPTEVQSIIHAHEAAGTTGSDAYQQAVEIFTRRHICRVFPFPEPLESSFRQLMHDPTVYHTMIGPSEFSTVGTLKDWSVVDRLDRIITPVLVLAGEFDEATPVSWEPFITRLVDVEHHLFAEASHTPHLETPEAYFRIVGEFLRRHDRIGLPAKTGT